MGAARLLRGLQALLEPTALAVVVNTADDEEFYGLHVSPDVDTVLYTLAGLAPVQRGWGLAGDSFHCLTALGRYYGKPWFRLGDRDLATHIFRTHALRCGQSLTQVTRALARALGVRVLVLPMTDDRVRTFVLTSNHRWLPFQRYLVCHAEEEVRGFRFRGISRARPTRSVLAALRRADWIILPPSNPFVSLGPILSLPGIRNDLRERRDRVLAVSPIIGSEPVKGPLHRMLAGLKHEVSAYGVARLLRSIARYFVLDERDAHHATRIEELGMTPILADTWMHTPEHSKGLARVILKVAR